MTRLVRRSESSVSGSSCKPAGFHVIKHAPGAIYVHAAERDDAAGDAAEGVHELLRLAARAENEIDDDVKLLPPEVGLMVLKELAIRQEFLQCRAGALVLPRWKDGDADGRVAGAVEPRTAR